MQPFLNQQLNVAHSMILPNNMNRKVGGNQILTQSYDGNNSYGSGFGPKMSNISDQNGGNPQIQLLNVNSNNHSKYQNVIASSSDLLNHPLKGIVSQSQAGI